MSAEDKFAPLNETDALKVERLIRVVEILRKLDTAIPASYIAAFLLVAAKPGKGSSEYARDLGLVQAVTSRILLEIGKKSRKGGPGLGLIDSEGDSVDLRLKKNFLTPEGRELLRQILNAMGHT